MPATAATKVREGPRLGLCCTFADAPIKFRVTTARYLSTLAPKPRAAFLSELCLHNVEALGQAISWCGTQGVGAFRVLSQLFPVYTHPQVGYRWQDLPAAAALERGMAAVKTRARATDVRLSFHPEQFVVPGSTEARVARSSLQELEYQGEVAARLGAEQLTIHGGGAQGGKAAALGRLRRGLEGLSDRARALVALENDDRVYTPADLLPLCEAEGLPLVYDVHHHRCNPDGLGVDETTARAARTWGRREPWFHVSSPALGWGGGDPRPHHDRVWLRDLPPAWRTMRGTVDVEAKGKERAVLKLAQALRR